MAYIPIIVPYNTTKPTCLVGDKNIKQVSNYWERPIVKEVTQYNTCLWQQSTRIETTTIPEAIWISIIWLFVLWVIWLCIRVVYDVSRM